MKKIILFLSFMFILSGCVKNSNSNIVEEINKKIENSKNYQMTGTLQIFRNEENFTYDIVSTYKKGDYFKVQLTNKKNNHEQIILKDKESVYVLTPSLNKSFKFQSEWPYNNSQIYLLQPIIKDIKNDKESKVEKTKEGYTIISNVNYSSEKDFKKQKIYLDLEKNIVKVEVLDDKQNIKMCLDVINIEYDTKIEENLFDINKYYNSTDTEEPKETLSNENNKATNSLEEIVYPMYVPTDTYLTGQDVVNTAAGERVILTFDGESQFTIIQENLQQVNGTNYVYGDPYLILDTIGTVTDYSVSWISDGIEYSVLSNTMSIDELLTVAQSISVKPVGK